MTKRTDFALTAAAIRDLDAAEAAPLTDEEQLRADVMREQILTTPCRERVRIEVGGLRRRRVLIPVGLLAAVAVVVAVPATLRVDPAFASWTATPTLLSSSAAEVAAAACLSHIEMGSQGARVVIAEQRGGWTYVLLEGRGEGACLMSDDLIAGDAPRTHGFFGSYDPDLPEAPTPPRDGIVETLSVGGSVASPGRLPFDTTEDWFGWVGGYAGRDVTGVTVHPPVGPDVEASLDGGRFSAWWPAGPASGDNLGVSGGWTYTVTLADGTNLQVEDARS